MDELKKELYEEQEGLCGLSGKELPDNTALFDKERLVERFKGGTYSPDNRRVVDPIEHMKRHGIYRERPEELAELKTMVDDREQFMKLVFKINNQLLAYKRGTDEANSETEVSLQETIEAIKPVLETKEKLIEKWVREHRKENPFLNAMMDIKGMGTQTAAYLLAYIDLKKANHASSLWAYVGFDKPAKDRYTKGEAGGGNKRLRTALHRWEETQIKCRSPYRDVYDRTKAKLEVSYKMVWSRNTQGKWVYVEWCATKPCHRHGAAMRAMAKHLLADYWFVGRTMLGLDTTPLYAVAQLGHSTVISPEERGWVY